MSGISKRVSGSWASGDYDIMKTATDTITTLPAVLYPNGATATVDLKGNTVQNGTPTPDSPVTPQSCGEKTENLFDYSAVTTGYRITWKTGALYPDSTGIMSDFIEVSEGETYEVSDTVIEAFTAYIIGYNSNKEYLGAYHQTDGFIKAASSRYSSINIPTGYDCKYIKLMTFTSYDLGNTSMFTEGSSLPSTFIPYGYKIPISSASTTTPVYLGEVQTTRQIKKLVLTGEETWSRSNTTQVLYTRIDNGLMLTNVILSCCSHYPTEKSVSSLSDVSTGYSTIRTSGYFVIKDINYSTYTAFQAYLAEQYANGTPVTVWYILATEETGIVNEPLCKIGDYADEVSTVSIPVTAGGDTISVDTTVPPSEVTVNYNGWHPAVVHERNNGAWTE